MWLVVLACGGDAPIPVDEHKAPPEAHELRTQAHADAYARLLPLAVDAFTLADPVAAAQLGLGAARVRPLATGERVRLRETVDATWNEAAQIDADALSTEEAAVLRVVRFGLLRVRDDLERRPLTRTDPGVAIAAVAELVDELGPARTPVELAALQQAAVMLREGLADLGATSPESLRAARADLVALRERVTEPPALATAIADADARLAAIATELAKAKTAAHADRVPRAATPSDVRRLPGRLGDAALRRRLEVEESETRPAKALLGEVLATTKSLAAMRKAVDSPAPVPVTADRCASVWTRVKDYAAEQPALVGAELDCAAFVAAWAGRELDDAALLVAVVHAGIVGPTRRARRRAELPALALVGGRVAPASHVHAQTLAVVSGLADPGARALALQRAGDALCLAATALAVHGDLHDDATLADALGPACAHRPVRAWLDEALARPRASLDGLGLTLVGRGPADAVALERWWWLPIGLVVPTARPSAPAKPEPTTKAVVEKLGEPKGGGS